MLNCDVKRIYHSNLIEKLISEPTNYGYTTIIAFIRNNNEMIKQTELMESGCKSCSFHKNLESLGFKIYRYQANYKEVISNLQSNTILFYCCPIKVLIRHKLGLIPFSGISPLWLFSSYEKTKINHEQKYTF